MLMLPLAVDIAKISMLEKKQGISDGITGIVFQCCKNMAVQYTFTAEGVHQGH